MGQHQGNRRPKSRRGGLHSIVGGIIIGENSGILVLRRPKQATWALALQKHQSLHSFGLQAKPDGLFSKPMPHQRHTRFAEGGHAVTPTAMTMLPDRIPDFSAMLAGPTLSSVNRVSHVRPEQRHYPGLLNSGRRPGSYMPPASRRP